MYNTHRIIIVCLFVALVNLLGCKSKQEKTNAGTGSLPDKTTTSATIPAQNKLGAKTASPTDIKDVRVAAQRVLSQIESGDFATIYKESATGFKHIGNESAFVNKFQQTRMKTGILNNPKEISFESRPDNVHVTVYRVENERFATDLRLTFQRAKNGTMELAGLNQHDELKK